MVFKPNNIPGYKAVIVFLTAYYSCLVTSTVILVVKIVKYLLIPFTHHIGKQTDEIVMLKGMILHDSSPTVIIILLIAIGVYVLYITYQFVINL